MIGRFREMPDFSLQKDQNKSFILELSKSKMFINLRKGYRIMGGILRLKSVRFKY
jgi:hypothetical protein